jgi:putative flippase GtrA
MLVLWRFAVRHRIAHFLLVGGFSTMVNLGVSFTLTSVVGLWYVTSAIMAFVVAYAVNFTLQKLWTFERPEKEGSGTQLFFHLMLQLCNLGLEVGSMYLLVEYAGLWYLYAQVAVLAVISVESFLITRRIFSHNASAP